MKKMNMVAKFEGVIDMLNGKSVEGFSKEDAEAFLRERIAQTTKKNASGGNKPTAQQIANEGTKQTIVAVLGEIGVPTTITDMQKHSTELASLSNQRVTALLTQLTKADVVVRTEVKGKAYFALPSAED